MDSGIGGHVQVSAAKGGREVDVNVHGGYGYRQRGGQ